MVLIKKYFPEITALQNEQFLNFEKSFTLHNAKLNLISRKDIDNLQIHHILHSLSIAKALKFRPGTRVLDVGTGGGLPGIPLAILFPETEFLLLDSINKKIAAATEIVREIGLENVKTLADRSENIKEKFDFVTARAVTAFPKFVHSVKHCTKEKQINSLPNGILYLKGGEFQEEIEEFKKNAIVYKISDFFDENYFETKKIIYLPM
jgi:16S rRNA (guanine527-N7)-methyltransferase